MYFCESHGLYCINHEADLIATFRLLMTSVFFVCKYNFSVVTTITVMMILKQCKKKKKKA